MLSDNADIEYVLWIKKFTFCQTSEGFVKGKHIILGDI